MQLFGRRGVTGTLNVQTCGYQPERRTVEQWQRMKGKRIQWLSQDAKVNEV